MSLFGKKEKKEFEEFKAQLPSETFELEEINNELEKRRSELNTINRTIKAKENHLSLLEEQLIETDERVLCQSFGLYTPHYAYVMSDEYKEALQVIREQQKQMITKDHAVTGSKSWTVNDNVIEGRKMIKDMQKLLLRAFNAECDDAIEHVRFNNIVACEKKIDNSAKAISNLGVTMEIHINPKYKELKLKELYLVHEYHLKKEEEKEAQKALRAQQREEAKAAKELEEERKKLEKEQTHYENAISKLRQQLETAKEEEKETLTEKAAELEQRLSEINTQMTEIDYREANQKAGYVYVASNIGAFGPNVFKIGMTRRLDPQDRIDELSSASVPFNFDVHAMIFTDDAPGLEAAIHKELDGVKLNLVNNRKEFFKTDIETIKKIIKENYDKSVEFTDIAPAEQYRISEKMRNSGQE